MSRQEFTRKTKAAVALRSGGNCEQCGAKLKLREGEYDHVLPCALGGTNDESNCKVICRICHAEKTGNDVRQIRKADRQRDKHTGTFVKHSAPMPGSKRSGWKKLMNGEVVRR